MVLARHCCIRYLRDSGILEFYCACLGVVFRYDKIKSQAISTNGRLAQCRFRVQGAVIRVLSLEFRPLNLGLHSGLIILRTQRLGFEVHFRSGFVHENRS